MLVDANILLYAVDHASPFHNAARSWLTSALNGPRRVGLPWQSLIAFVRISTHERASQNPLSAATAMDIVDEWLDAEASWVPAPGPGHAAIFRELVTRHRLHGNLISDAHLAALAIEHGVALCSADTDFARFDGLQWVNPISLA